MLRAGPTWPPGHRLQGGSEWTHSLSSSEALASRMVLKLPGESSGGSWTRPLAAFQVQDFSDVTAGELQRLQADCLSYILHSPAILMSINIYKRGSCFRPEGACLLPLKDINS